MPTRTTPPSRCRPVSTPGLSTLRPLVYEGVMDPFSAVTDLAVGLAAEHLVCCELLLKGYTAFRTDQVYPYDIAVMVDRRLLRVQVEATRGHYNL